MQVKWITFHSGYDFGYLLKVLTCQPLPKAEVEFFELLKVGLRTHCPSSSDFFLGPKQLDCAVSIDTLCAMQIYFPTVYDIKYLMKFCDNLHGGLNKLAEVLQVERIGPQHQVWDTYCGVLVEIIRGFFTMHCEHASVAPCKYAHPMGAASLWLSSHVWRAGWFRQLTDVISFCETGIIPFQRV